MAGPAGGPDRTDEPHDHACPIIRIEGRGRLASEPERLREIAAA